MDKERAFLFLCDQTTESECIAKQMVGAPQTNALWAMNVKQGDHIYLFNFNTRVIRGPYVAASTADCYDASAWRGKFPIQVKVAKTVLTKIADGRSQDAPKLLFRNRPLHELERGDELFSWIQASGKDLDDER